MRIDKLKPGLTVEQHRKIGLELFDMHECLQETVAQLSQAYRVRTKVAGKAYQLLVLVEALRKDLLALLQNENPRMDGNALRKMYFPNEE
jgi:hypothetical protein